MNHQPDLSESERRRFCHAAGGYGVEVYGGEVENRESLLLNYLQEPVTVVDGRDITDAEGFVKTALVEMGTSEGELKDRYTLGSVELRRALAETEHSLVILEFDSLADDVQTNVARMMKGVAESIQSDEVMLGFSAEEGGAVVRAEPDLRMRVLSWEIDARRSE